MLSAVGQVEQVDMPPGLSSQEQLQQVSDAQIAACRVHNILDLVGAAIEWATPAPRW